MLALIEAHLTNSQIAAELCLSVRTVESHVSSLMRKLLKFIFSVFRN